jgi:glutathione S-transferase
MRTLWGRANSSNVMKVICLLEELGLPYERIDVGGPFGKTKTPEYLAMNPNSVVPTLQEGDFTLWESNVILRYLCTAYAKGHSLWPDDLQVRANIDRWMDWVQTTLTRPQGLVFQGLVRIPPEKRDNAAIEAAIVELGRVYQILDAELAKHGQDYVAGPAYSLADIAIGPHVHRWFVLPIPRPDTPHLHAWYQRLLGRPVYRTHCAGPLS